MSDKQIDKPTPPVTTDVKPATNKPAKKTKSGAGFAKFLSCVALIVACGTSAFGWVQLQLIKQQLNEQQSTVDSIDQSDKLVNFKQNLAKRFDSFSDQQHIIQGKLKSLESAVSASASAASRDQRGWVLAEAEYLMNGFAALEHPALNPATTQLACVGQQTAQALSQQGYHTILQPQQDFSSKGLLSLSAFQQVNAQRILIVRGKGGRELLKQVLEQRGAQVDYLECYQRLLPQIDYRPLHQAIHQQGIDVISCSSNQALDNLLQVVPETQLFKIPFLPISSAMATKAKYAGFNHIINTANNASDEAILEALCQYQTTR